jgi:hypothetical protein
MPGVVSHCQKRRMVSNLLKRWWDDFVTVKRRRNGFGAFQKETGCHPTSSHPTSSTMYKKVLKKRENYLIAEPKG